MPNLTCMFEKLINRMHREMNKSCLAYSYQNEKKTFCLHKAREMQSKKL